MADNNMAQAAAPAHVVVIGGGITGLAAAFFLRDQPVRVTVLEGSSRLGGQLSTAQLAGVTIDEGAESMYARRPKTARLLQAAGLTDQVVAAATKSMAIYTRGQIRPQPDRQFMGVPCDLDELAKSGIVSDAAVARARQDLTLAPTERHHDVSVADYVAGRLGREVVDRLVEPFLADAYFGRADELSFEATLTPLATAARRHTSLTAAAAALLPPPPPPGEQPTTGISTLARGLGSLPQTLADHLLAASPHSRIRTHTPVHALTRRTHGWRITTGTPAHPEHLDADAVILAVPADQTRRLLTPLPATTAATTALADIPHAGSLIITLAYPRNTLAPLRPLGHSGYRIPTIDGHALKIVTFSTIKWPHLTDDIDIIRCQAAGSGHEDLLHHDDTDLVTLATTEITQATHTTNRPLATHITRWPATIPQYTTGHHDRVTRIRTTLHNQPHLAVCGAAYDGIGIGQCITSALKATEHILTQLPTPTPQT
ncbi:protoporphyrinogen oxidase [Streptomyces sp. NPDC051051]|uniref:protoporphyrinogen oxidase n=1 Tax=Streptomyces sp. NPDC051051 TaxID=3155666 RepID=UPI003433B440